MPTLRDRVPASVKSIVADAQHRLAWSRSPQARITRAFVRQHGLTVQAGPFAGMVYPPLAVGRGELVVAQLLGAYENELHEAFARVIAWGPEQIVDVGASDGYYAVGLARACPQATVQAFEMNPFPARVCTALAEANGVVDRVVLRGEATLEELRVLPRARTFVLSDCEGCEGTLMDPEAVPWLREAALIVELHEFAVPDIHDAIHARFGATHDIEVIDSRARWIADWPLLMSTDGVTYVDRELGVSEFRPHPMRWAVLTPREA